jgi:hypothetical protein
MADQITSLAKGEVVWGKPEQATAKILKWVTLGGIGVAIFFFWGIIAPFVVATLANTLLTALYAGLLLLLALVVSNRRVHTLLSYMGRSAFRAVASFVVETDPIGILESHVEDARENLGKMDTHIKRLNGEISKTQRIIDKNASEADRNLGMVKQASKGAKNDVNRETAILSARQAGRLQQSNVTLGQMLKRIKILYTVLTKVRSNLNVMVQDMASEIVVKRQEYEAINAAFSAYASAMKVVNGDASQRELYEMAMRHLDDNYAQKAGAIEEFVQSSAGFLNGLDLQNGMFEENALKMLEDMEKRSMALLGDGSEHALIGEYTDPDTHQDDVTALFRRL